MAVLSNAPGALVMAGTVSAATFAGPPIVAYGTRLDNGDARWPALLAFAANFKTRTSVYAPILGASDSTDLAAIRAALVGHSVWWRTSRLAQPQALPVTSTQRGSALDSLVVCGPVIVAPAGGTEYADVVAAWAWTVQLSRQPLHHCLGIGLSAASASYPHLSPPVYGLSSVATGALNFHDQLATMASVWLQPPTPTLAQHEAKYALVVSDPDTHRFLHPSLLGTVLRTSAP